MSHALARLVSGPIGPDPGGATQYLSVVQPSIRTAASGADGPMTGWRLSQPGW